MPTPPESFDHDHDHVLSDLAVRYEEILAAVEATDGWVTSVRASRPPMTRMGSLGGIEAGLRQLRRTRPLELVAAEVPGAGPLQVPTDAVSRTPYSPASSSASPSRRHGTSRSRMNLPAYKGLEPRWQHWSTVVSVSDWPG